MATGLFKFGFSRSKTRPSPSNLDSEAEEITEEADAHPGNLHLILRHLVIRPITIS